MSLPLPPTFMILKDKLLLMLLVLLGAVWALFAPESVSAFNLMTAKLGEKTVAGT